jgi:hypothetical protein
MPKFSLANTKLANEIYYPIVVEYFF